MYFGSSTHRILILSRIFFCLLSINGIIAIDHLNVAFQWKQIEYDWPNEDVKKLFPDYKQEDNIPVGLEVAGDKLFITVPKWKRGVVSSLNYIKINDTRESPPLMPYPSWDAHKQNNGIPEIVSTFRIRADNCDRLWVLDTGLIDILGNTEQQAPPSLLIYNLKTDELLRKYVIPEIQRTPDSLFANIAVEDYDCQDTYAYLGDLGGPGVVIYSWKKESSWLVKHNYFLPDPKASDFNVGGVNFHWSDGVFGMALEPIGDGYSNLYFHPLSSIMEYSINTRVLRSTELLSSPDVYQQFKVLGSRGTNGQSSTSFLDPSTGILFYGLANLNAIACWKTGTNYNIQKQGRIYMDNVTMVFPNDLKIDRNGMIWVLSDRLPTFMYQHLDPNEYNFRILNGYIKEAIQGTVCAMNSQFDQNAITSRPTHSPSSPSSSSSSSSSSDTSYASENEINKNNYESESTQQSKKNSASYQNSLVSLVSSLAIISLFINLR